MDLSGPWRGASANEELRRTFHEPSLDDRGWSRVDVPGHWSHIGDLRHARSVLHRHRFHHLTPAEGRRSWLCFEGIVGQGDVWLDGSYVGDTDGYFVPHRFEITEQLRARDDHLLAVDVTCGEFGDPDARTLLTGALQDPELTGAAGANPGGVWRPVSIHETGSNAVRFFRAVCADAGTIRARIALRCVLDAPAGGDIVLRTRVAGTEHELTHSAAVGENRIEWSVEVPDPELWWPHALGDQPLHQLTCEVLADGEVHDQRSCRIGFRSVRMRNWILSVNDVRLFAKGVCLLPTTPRPGDASPAEVAADVGAARDAGLDLVRAVAHVARPEVYHRADEIGMLIWQDLPLRGVMARGVRQQATRQAREAVDLLGHHPSVAVWCAHDEPFRRPDPPSPTPPVIDQQGPSWNRAILDRSVKRVLDRADGSRPVVAHTAVPPHIPNLDGTTSHLWFGWHGGRATDAAPAIARAPRTGQFVTAFGAASVNPDHPLLADGWPDIDWDELAAATGAPAGSLRRLVPPDRIDDGATWARLTRTAQAQIIRTTVELLRRLKFRPTGGFAGFVLTDATAAGGYGLLDVERRTKPAFGAMMDACRPVIVVADPLPPLIDAGETYEIAVHVVSDLRDQLVDAVVRAGFAGPGGEVTSARWTGTIPADDCSLVGRLDVTVPATDGEYVLDLELTTEETVVTNRYFTAVR